MLRNEAKAASCFHNPVAQIKRHFGGEKGIGLSPYQAGTNRTDPAPQASAEAFASANGEATWQLTKSVVSQSEIA